jgi:hypothetical protein
MRRVSCVILRSVTTKNLPLTFLFERIEKSAKQMLHFVQHDTKQTPTTPKDSFSLDALCVFARARWRSELTHTPPGPNFTAGASAALRAP